MLSCGSSTISTELSSKSSRASSRHVWKISASTFPWIFSCGYRLFSNRPQRVFVSALRTMAMSYHWSSMKLEEWKSTRHPPFSRMGSSASQSISSSKMLQSISTSHSLYSFSSFTSLLTSRCLRPVASAMASQSVVLPTPGVPVTRMFGRLRSDMACRPTHGPTPGAGPPAGLQTAAPASSSSSSFSSLGGAPFRFLFFSALLFLFRFLPPPLETWAGASAGAFVASPAPLLAFFAFLFAFRSGFSSVFFVACSAAAAAAFCACEADGVGSAEPAAAVFFFFFFFMARARSDGQLGLGLAWA
mmetsp:Transcript_54978/g.144577  ORF Transcript_54978/g.144577 Transcript_54978/m.144577 type:complete len:302 (+) Transcript_54978:103-1008(+)